MLVMLVYANTTVIAVNSAAVVLSPCRDRDRHGTGAHQDDTPVA